LSITVPAASDEGMREQALLSAQSLAESAIDLMEASCFRNGETVKGQSPPAAARAARP